MIVLDASVAIEILLHTSVGIRSANALTDEDVHAPHLLDLEFTQALRRLTFSSDLDENMAELALDELSVWRIERHAHTDFLRRIWQLRHSVSAYDACYVALAEELGAPLMTCDAKLSRSRGHRAKIVLLS
ncbi:MAG TPA: type II toxin-antitoxin system VapC family toxin [Rhizomicrobium sp.]